MAITAMAIVQKNKMRLLAVWVSCFPFIAMSGDWKFTPQFTLDETYSDNVELTVADETSSLVSQMGVIINEQYTDSDAQLDFNLHSIYAMYSHDSDLNDDYHTLDASGFINLGFDGLSLTGKSSISNQSQSVGNNSLADIVSGDTVEVRTYNTGLAYKVNNSDFTLNVATNYSDTSSEDRIGENNGFTSTINSKNGNGANDVFWDISAKHQDLTNNSQDRTMFQTELKIGLLTKYRFNPFIRYFDENYDGNFGNQTTESNSYGLGVRWLVTPRLQLDLSYNKPIDDVFDENDELFEEYVDSRLLWEPSNRTSVEVNFSQRFFGDSYGLNIKHRNRRLTNTISYTEQVETFTRFNFGNEGDDTVPVEDDNFSLNRRLAWSTELALSRTSFSMTLSGNNREDLVTKDEDQYRSANLTISRQVSGYSSLSFSSSYTKSDIYTGNIDTLITNQVDQYRRYSVNYNRQLNSRISTTLGISYLNRDSSQEQHNYQEGRVTFQVKKGF